jgi:predicted permease
MGWLNSFTRGLRGLFQSRHVSREVDEEIANYLEASVAHKMSTGMAADVARRAALVEMGSASAVKQQVLDSRWESIVDNFLQDLRFSVRSLRKHVAFTSVALLSLGLGIGANTAIFTLVRQVLIEDLPVQDPEKLVTFGDSANGGVAGGIDLGQYGFFPWYFARQLESNPGPFQGIAAFGSFSPKVMVRPPASNGFGDSNAVPLVPANLVSGNYFQVLGAQALFGRTILPSDAAAPGTGAVAVLSYPFWQRTFHSDPGIIGQTISLNRTPFTVVGVMPRPFQGIKIELEPTALWIPDTIQPIVFQQPSLLTPESDRYFLHMFGRLGLHAGFAQSQAWLNQQIHAGTREHDGSSVNPARAQEISREVVPLVPAVHGVSTIRMQYRDSLWILTGAVATLLIIACVNLANFLLARAASRQRETATRLALGSSRGRIVRQSLCEALLLSLTGGLLGLGVAFASTRALIAFINRGSSASALNPVPDLSVLLFTLVLSLLTALLFGLVPALVVTRSSASFVSANTRTAQSSGGRSARTWPKALVTAQVALSLVLLIGAGLLIRTLRNLQNQDYGFDRIHLVVAQFDASIAGYTPIQTASLHQRLLDRLSELPGVRSAALAATPPVNPGGWSSTISLSGYTPAPKENMVSILNRVSGRYFETAGIPIIAGRRISDADTSNSLKIAVVNQTLANHYFPQGNALGQLLTVGIDSARGPWRIVGIARDTKSSDPRDRDPIRMTYLPLAQIEPYSPADTPAVSPRNERVNPTPREQNQDRFANVILIRVAGSPTHAIAGLRAAVSAVDPNLPLISVTTMQADISNFISHDELISTLTGIFSLIALALAAIGLYGVMSYNVARRKNEIGIRVALGAEARVVRLMVLRESLVLLVIGVGVGLPLAVTSKNLISHQLFGVSSLDPITYAIALAVVSAMTLFAAWMPARDASTVDPMVALRAD